MATPSSEPMPSCFMRSDRGPSHFQPLFQGHGPARAASTTGVVQAIGRLIHQFPRPVLRLGDDFATLPGSAPTPRRGWDCKPFEVVHDF